MPTNYYELLSLSTNDSTDAIQKALQQLRIAWQARATRSGTTGDHAHQMLQHIAHATEIFADQTSRDRYDLSLLASTEDPETDWTEKSERYLESGELIAAQIAVAKARQADTTNLHALVMSAVIEMELADQASDKLSLKDRYRQAQLYIDEAMVLDVNEEHIVKVHTTRGLILARQQEWDQAITSFDLALERTTGDPHATIAWYKARCLTAADATTLCLDTLLHATELHNDTADKLVALCCHSSDKAASTLDNWPARQRHYQRLLLRIEYTTTPAKGVVPHIKERISYCQDKIQLTQKAEDLRQKLIDLDDTASLLRDYQAAAETKLDEVSSARWNAEQQGKEKRLLHGCGGCALIPWTMVWLLVIGQLREYPETALNPTKDRIVIALTCIALISIPWALLHWRRSKCTRLVDALREEEAKLNEAVTSLRTKIGEKEKQRSRLQYQLYEALKEVQSDDLDIEFDSFTANY